MNVHALCYSHDINLHVEDIPPDSRGGATRQGGSCDTLIYTHDGSFNVQILASAPLKAPSFHQTTHLEYELLDLQDKMCGNTNSCQIVLDPGK